MAEEQLSGAFWGGDDLSDEEEFDEEEEEEEEFSSDDGFLDDSDEDDEERGPVLSADVKADRDLQASIDKLMEELEADNWIGVQKGAPLPAWLPPSPTPPPCALQPRH